MTDRRLLYELRVQPVGTHIIFKNGAVYMKTNTAKWEACSPYDLESISSEGLVVTCEHPKITWALS